MLGTICRLGKVLNATILVINARLTIDTDDNPLLTVWIGRKAYIYCHDATTATDLMEKRAEIYSSRPKMIVMGDLRGSTGKDQVALEYNDQWRLHRKLMHTAVGVQAIKGHRPAQSYEGKLLLRDLLMNGKEFESAIERYSVSVVSIVGWGKLCCLVDCGCSNLFVAGRRIDRMNDPVARAALKFMESVDMILPGIYMAETIPELVKLPRWIYALPSNISTVSKDIFSYVG